MRLSWSLKNGASALIVGGSGAVGSELLRLVLAGQSYQTIHLLLRHSLGYTDHPVGRLASRMLACAANSRPGCHIIENEQLLAGITEADTD